METSSSIWPAYRNLSGEIRVEAFRNLVWGLGFGLTAVVGLSLAGVRTWGLVKSTQTETRRHRTETLSTSIEQLGNSEFALRLGSILSLEQLMKDAPNLRISIIEALCSYTREKFAHTTDFEEFYESLKENKGDLAFKRSALRYAPEELQLIIDVLARRKGTLNERPFLITLHGINCGGSFIDSGHFPFLDLSYSDLSCIKFQDTNITGSRFTRAIADNAQFIDCALKAVIFSEIILTHTTFMSCRGPYFSLMDARCEDVFISDCVLRASEFFSCDFTDSEMLSCDFSRSLFGQCNISGARISDCSFRKVKFEEIDFDENTKIERCDFMGAVGLPDDFFDTVTIDSETKW